MHGGLVEFLISRYYIDALEVPELSADMVLRLNLLSECVFFLTFQVQW